MAYVPVGDLRNFHGLWELRAGSSSKMWPDLIKGFRSYGGLKLGSAGDSIL